MKGKGKEIVIHRACYFINFCKNLHPWRLKKCMLTIKCTIPTFLSPCTHFYFSTSGKIPCVQLVWLRISQVGTVRMEIIYIKILAFLHLSCLPHSLVTVPTLQLGEVPDSDPCRLLQFGALPVLTVLMWTSAGDFVLFFSLQLSKWNY